MRGAGFEVATTAPEALVRLQRILLLRELGLGLPQIADVLDRDGDEIGALERHLTWLRHEQDRLARQIVAVTRTIEARRGGEELMAEDMFDGFDHTQHREEVTERWGADAYQTGDRWWRGMSAHEDLRGYLRGLGEMYVADERFARNYGGADGAAFVRDALRAYAETL